MRFAALIVISGLMILGGTYGVLVYFGVANFKLPSFGYSRADAADSAEIQVPSSFRPLAANTVVSNELLVNPRTRLPAMRAISAKLIEEKDVCTTVEQIVGRMLKHSKRTGDLFVEADFYPATDEPEKTTLSVPEGMTAIVVSTSKLPGCRKFIAGNHIDITVPPTDKLLVTDGIVITPAAVVQVLTDETQTGATVAKQIEQIKLAVKADEVIGLLAAIESGTELKCVAHFDRPVVATPPAPRQRTVEKVVGRDHEIIIVTPAGTQPSVAPAPVPQPNR